MLADIPESAPAFAEEVFGPVAPVLRLSTVDEALRIATNTDYGLALGIVTRDPLKGLELADTETRWVTMRSQPPTYPF